LQQRAYELQAEGRLDPLECNDILRLGEEVIGTAYTSIISPFPFHNCYSIEDVKAFIDMVRMINPGAVISVKVSPSVDIEFIAAGLGRIARDNSDAAADFFRKKTAPDQLNQTGAALAEYVRQYGMKLEIWLDGPRGGTGASPNIIKGQMGMHIEYAIPLIHDRLVRDGLRNHVSFFVSGGIRTYEDVIKAVALGADGVIWGTAPLVAIGCDRNRNCHDGCSRGIATSNLIMQKLRDVEQNSQQMINAFVIMQMQLIRALAALGCNDIRELRGRFDKIHWLGLKERVDFRRRQQKEFARRSQEFEAILHQPGQTNCGVAALIGTEKIPSYILDQALESMKNRGMDGVGVGKTLCFPEFPDHYAFRIMVKGRLQPEIEQRHRSKNAHNGDEIAIRSRSRAELLRYRLALAEKIRNVFLKPYFDLAGESGLDTAREPYKCRADGQERDFREFGGPATDPGDIFRFFVRVKREVLHEFIEQIILKSQRYAYIREYFPDIDAANYRDFARFLTKAEDLFVFDQALLLSECLYVWETEPTAWREFVMPQHLLAAEREMYIDGDPLAPEQLAIAGEGYLRLLRQFSVNFRQTEHKASYVPRSRRIATVMSAGKNFAVWKTAGREIPWETPAAPNNIIHVRLATGSIVEQMNAHPFAKLHTALTHNGETTNYETLKQRVEQFGLPPLATTDTEVAALKFHLVADELEYPDWALFESFSPTTGDDLCLIRPELRPFLEEVQRVEFSSSPDGPYQYLCLRHNPEKKVTERIDLKDPADLRPSTTAFWQDEHAGKKRIFSMIASEEQALMHMLQLLDREGLIDGALPDALTVSGGMISRYHYRDSGEIEAVEFLDRYGEPITLPDFGEHYSYQRTAPSEPAKREQLEALLAERALDLQGWLRDRLPEWDFPTYRWILEQISARTRAEQAEERIALLTFFIDYLRTMNTGRKAKSSLIDITRQVLYQLFDRLPELAPLCFTSIKLGSASVPGVTNPADQTLLIDASGFAPEGLDPAISLASLLGRAYDLGWRRFRLYRVNGQRLISTAVMGHHDSPDVVIDVYGTPGEYLGAFMQGGLLRVHGNAQNFAAMGMHHGEIQVFGNAGKVCGYASKGGKVFILGDINDRAWTNSVNDSRGQDLCVQILGSASKYAGESLMGGDFLFLGLTFEPNGTLCLESRPCRGTKLLGGASRGRFLFFDPDQRLDPQQYVHGYLAEIAPADWLVWQARIIETLQLAGCPLENRAGGYYLRLKDRDILISPAQFRLILPKGGLKGYESH
jgi:glutamate synthase domain-containing protein 1